MYGRPGSFVQGIFELVASLLLETGRLRKTRPRVEEAMTRSERIYRKTMRRERCRLDARIGTKHDLYDPVVPLRVLDEVGWIYSMALSYFFTLICAWRCLVSVQKASETGDLKLIKRKGVAPSQSSQEMTVKNSGYLRLICAIIVAILRR